jgi:hypothetical protein
VVGPEGVIVANRKKEARLKRKEEQKILETRKQRRRGYRRASLYMLGSVVVLLAGYGIFAFWFQRSPGMIVPGQGNLHILDPALAHAPYNTDPPTSGPHLPSIALWGVHKEEIPKELQVHNLEDGGVIIQYNCQGCPDLVEKLERFALKHSNVIVAPYSRSKTRISLTAWTRIDQFDEYDESRILRFIRAYVGIDHHPKNR